jgi:hypothetical protein
VNEMTVAFGNESSADIREMAEQMGVPVPEAVRRGMTLLRLWMALDEGERLLIHRADGQVEQVFVYFDNSEPEQDAP